MIDSDACCRIANTGQNEHIKFSRYGAIAKKRRVKIQKFDIEVKDIYDLIDFRWPHVPSRNANVFQK